MPLKKNIGVPERHAMTVAIQTLRMPDALVGVMGGGTKKDAREFLKKLGLTDKEIDAMITSKTNKVKTESSESAETDDYGVLPFVREAGNLRYRSYTLVKDEDMVVEEDEDESEKPMLDVGDEFEVTSPIAGLAELEIGRTYRIDAVDGDPPVYAIVGDKNRKVVEINAALFDDIIRSENEEPEEGQDDDAQDGELGEWGPSSPLNPRSGAAKARAHAKAKGLVKGPGGNWIRKPGADPKRPTLRKLRKMVFGKMRKIDPSRTNEEIDEARLMELDMEKKRASIGRRSNLRSLGADVVGSMVSKSIVKNKSARKMARKELARAQSSGTGCRPGFKMVFGKCRAVSESEQSEVKMKVPIIIKKKDKGNGSLEMLRGLRESLISEGCGAKKRKRSRKMKGEGAEGCGCGVAESAEADDALDTLKSMGFGDKEAKLVHSLFVDNALNRTKFFAAVKSIKRPPRTDWGDVFERLYDIYD